MKLLVLSCCIGVLVSEVLGLGYHADVGIPEAVRIQRKEAQEASSRIIGGFASGYGDNPHLAGVLITLMSGQMSVCSGTLLSERKVLTAGQCWYDGYQQGRMAQVVLGSTRLFSGSRYEVSGVSVHPGFKPSPLANDLAMLTTRYKVYFYSSQRPALLPTFADVNKTYSGVYARVSGYGKTSDWSQIGPNTEQNAVNLQVIDSWYDCYYNMPQRPEYAPENILCTSGSNGWGTCGGDLGGPLVIPDYFNGSSLLIGVTSIQSPIGCSSGFATGYMKVASFLSWIKLNM